MYCIADDIMVVGYEKDHSDHNKALTNLFQRAEKCNLKFNLDKIQYKKTEVSFFGENIHYDGPEAQPRQSRGNKNNEAARKQEGTPVVPGPLPISYQVHTRASKLE